MSTPHLPGQAAALPTADLRAVLQDELRLGQLLRWSNIDPPSKLVENFWLWGTAAGETGIAARLARTTLPRWRRCWSAAGELIARCGLNLQQGADSAAVSARSGAPVIVLFADHASRDAALFYAICQAAIAYLEAERAAAEADLAALRARRDLVGA